MNAVIDSFELYREVAPDLTEGQRHTLAKEAIATFFEGAIDGPFGRSPVAKADVVAGNVLFLITGAERGEDDCTVEERQESFYYAQQEGPWPYWLIDVMLPEPVPYTITVFDMLNDAQWLAAWEFCHLGPIDEGTHWLFVLDQMKEETAKKRRDVKRAMGPRPPLPSWHPDNEEDPWSPKAVTQHYDRVLAMNK